MGASPSVESVLKGAHKALDSANKFQHKVTAGKPDLAAKPDTKTAPAASNYTHVREARKSPGEFMGVRSDQAGELNSAMASHESAKAALNDNQ